MRLNSEPLHATIDVPWGPGGLTHAAVGTTRSISSQRTATVSNVLVELAEHSVCVQILGVDVPARRRSKLKGTRNCRVVVRFSASEFDAIRQAATSSGLAVAAWLGDLAARSSCRTGWSLASNRQDVVRQLMRVRQDVALAERVQREVKGAEVLKLLSAAVQRLDELVDGVVDDPGR
ncbi:hypothetical protein [Pseudonocardia sp. GCM10023141]|uniref:hypothetical protein n=1 Tax=Pseudonocardia sp. GCM10023141 TaxID=3252653 RepID=UPI00360AB412